MPVSRQTLADSVFADLLERVLSGDLPPQSSLPAEAEIAKAADVSRLTVREALKTLQDGLGNWNDAWTAQQMAGGMPARLRDAIVVAHPLRESKKVLLAASKALDRADAAAGYWREAASDA